MDSAGCISLSLSAFLSISHIWAKPFLVSTSLQWIFKDLGSLSPSVIVNSVWLQLMDYAVRISPLPSSVRLFLIFRQKPSWWFTVDFEGFGNLVGFDTITEDFEGFGEAFH